MLTRPTNRPPTTSKKAHAEFKKYGPRMSTQEARQLDRGAELYQRAEKIKETEKRRRELKRKRLEKEAREREARHRMGIPKPKPTVPRSQILLEGFLKPGKVNVEDVEEKSSIECELSSDDDMDSELDDTTLMKAITKATSAQIPSEIEEKHSLAVTSSEAHLRAELADAWDDFLMSNTQIEREITLEQTKSLSSIISTQDVSFSEEDLEELGVDDQAMLLEASKSLSASSSKFQVLPKLMPPPSSPVNPTKRAIAQETMPKSTIHDPWPLDFGLSTQDLRDVEF